MAGNKVKVLLLGQMALLTQASSKITTFMAKESTNGQTADFIKALGSITKCIAMEFSLGQMGVAMKATTVTIRNKAGALFNGVMGDATLVAGIMGSSMAMDCIYLLVGSSGRESGI